MIKERNFSLKYSICNDTHNIHKRHMHMFSSLRLALPKFLLSFPIFWVFERGWGSGCLTYSFAISRIGHVLSNYYKIRAFIFKHIRCSLNFLDCLLTAVNHETWAGGIPLEFWCMWIGVVYRINFLYRRRNFEFLFPHVV